MATKLEQALQAVQSGNLSAGQSLLAQVIREDPGNENAWLWLAGVLDDPLKKRQCLEKVLQLNPENEQAWRDLARLETGVEAPMEEEAGMASKPMEVQAPESFLEEPATPDVEAVPTDSEPSGEVVDEQSSPAGLETFWAGLASVKKDTGETSTPELPVEQEEIELTEDLQPAGQSEGTFPWLSEEEEVVNEAGVEPEEAQDTENFADFLQSLKDSGQYEEPASSAQPYVQPLESGEQEEPQAEETGEEQDWAGESLHSTYQERVHEEAFQPLSSVTSEGITRRQTPKPKMTRSQTNLIIILAVITFLILLAALGYIIWDLLPTL